MMMGYNVVMNEILRSPLRSLSVLDEISIGIRQMHLCGDK